jgi:hypothetical protein
VCSATTVLLAGCAGGMSSSPVSTTTPILSSDTGQPIKGTVFGGQQPVVGAHVYLLAAGVSGYGGASVSLLDAAETGSSDSIGAYVTTGAGGAFSITGDYSCTSGQQLYLYASGGNPGAGVNTAAAAMASLGGCSSSATSSVMNVSLNEATTIATAYAIAGYAVDAVHVSSSGTPLAQKGVANAFANAANLVDLPSGALLAKTPGGNGVVPQTELNTLSDILASCVNTAQANGSTASSQCAALFALATSDGTSTGTQPTETATAAINIAHHPGLNVGGLYALNGGGTAPFQPQLAAAPNDFTVQLAFSSNYAGTADGQPNSLAVDASGNIWAVEPFCNSTPCTGSIPIFEFSPLGVPASNTGFTPAPYSLTTPISVAVDATSSNVWVTDGSAYPGNTLYQTSPAVVKFGIAQGSGLLRLDATSIPDLTYPTDAALDANGNVWVSDQNGYLTHLNSSTGAVTSQIVGAQAGCGICAPASRYASVEIEPGATGNVWATSINYGYVNAYSSSGARQTGSPYYVVAGAIGAASGAIDAGGNIWLPG